VPEATDQDGDPFKITLLTKDASYTLIEGYCVRVDLTKLAIPALDKFGSASREYRLKFRLTDTNPAGSKTKLETLRVRMKFKGDVEVIKVAKDDRDEGDRARTWERPRIIGVDDEGVVLVGMPWQV
jgi:hypothetical protein